MTLAEGVLVSPELRLVRLLGEGGMATVWLADHLTLRAKVAIKFLSRSLISSDGALARFESEAQSAAQIRSPHVVQIYGHGVWQGDQPYIVMELLEGEDLGHRIEEGGPLQLHEVLQVVTQIGRALSRAHELGIVHRDIKPDNIFLVDEGGDTFAKLLDFGIAKHPEMRPLRVTTTGMLVGTPYYMSPEQVLNAKEVDEQADLWALTVVAYEALTGLRPFDGETVGAICVAIDKATFRPVSEVRPELPRGLDAWFARAFARDVSQRFASARALAQGFAEALVRAPAQPEPPRPEPPPPPRVRSPRVPMAIVSGCVVAAWLLSRGAAQSPLLPATAPPSVALPPSPEPAASTTAAAPSPEPPRASSARAAHRPPPRRRAAPSADAPRPRPASSAAPAASSPHARPASSAPPARSAAPAKSVTAAREPAWFTPDVDDEG